MSNLPRIDGIERIWLEVSGWKVEAWYIPPQVESSIKTAPIVIFAHGNAETIDDWPFMLNRINQLGMGLLLVEYPGYGRSEGRPSQDSITAAMKAAYDTLLHQKNINPDQIVLMGRSLGGAAVCQLAAARPVASLILLSSFTSARNLVKRYFVPTFLLLDPYDNLAIVAKLQIPIAIFHGKHDMVVPFGHGQTLAQSAPNGRLYTYSSGHNDFPFAEEFFWQDLREFLNLAGFKTEL